MDIAIDHFNDKKVGPGAVGFNAGHLPRSDNTNMEDVTESVMLGRRLAREYHLALKEFVPEAFGGSFLAATASDLGVRETQRIEGDYTLTADDWIARRSFEDEKVKVEYELRGTEGFVRAEASDRYGNFIYTNPLQITG